jgi:hypothetical protein
MTFENHVQRQINALFQAMKKNRMEIHKTKDSINELTARCLAIATIAVKEGICTQDELRNAIREAKIHVNAIMEADHATEERGEQENRFRERQ